MPQLVIRHLEIPQHPKPVGPVPGIEHVCGLPLGLWESGWSKQGQQGIQEHLKFRWGPLPPYILYLDPDRDPISTWGQAG